jgi:hypothetical protein
MHEAPPEADKFEDYPDCPHCGEDVDLMRLDEVLYRCGVCDEVFYDVDPGDYSILAGIDLEDQLPGHRGEDADGLRQAGQRAAPVVGKLHREKQESMDFTAFTIDTIEQSATISNFGDGDWDYGYSAG